MGVTRTRARLFLVQAVLLVLAHESSGLASAEPASPQSQTQSPASPQSPEDKRRIEISNVACDGDLELAKRLLRDLIRDTNGKERLDRALLVQLLRAENKYAETVPILEQLVKEQATVPAQALLGHSLFAVNRPKEATKYLKLVLDEPSLCNDIALIELGIAYQMSGDTDKAIETYRLAWDRYPTKISTAESRAWGNLLKHEPECARREKDYMPFATAIWTVKWSASRMPLKVFIDETGVDSKVASKYRPELMRAFDEWTTASTGKIKFSIVESKDAADIVCRWLRPAKTSSTMGHGQPFANKSGIVHAEVTLDTTMFGEIPPSPDLVHLLCLHEVGHALGLMHSPDANDLMCPIIGTAHGLSDRDKNTLLHLYSDDVPIEVHSATRIKYEDNVQQQRKLQSLKLIDEKDFPGFIASARSTIEADPTSSVAAEFWNRVGVLHTQANHKTEAEVCFKNALATPNQTAHNRKLCLSNYSVLLHRMGREEESVKLRAEADAIKDEPD